MNDAPYAPKHLIVDLDGTLALDDHRRPLIPTQGWKAYFEACVGDTLNRPVARFVRMMYQNGYKVHILTGRCNSVRLQTEEWLHRHGVQWDDLSMRADGSYDPTGTSMHKDFRPDHEVKLEMIQQLNLTPEKVFACLDDRDHMVKFWRDMGFTCWQVRPEGTLY